MVYVPAGRFVYGSSDDEDTRSLMTHEPAHDVEVAAFLIARTEVTNRDYLAFLGALPPGERSARLPSGLTLSTDGRVLWKLREKTLEPGEAYCDGVQPCVDWVRLPIDGANREDGERFAEWLSRSGRLPRARLCTDREWERAARGADDRRYPSGNGDLAPDDACMRDTFESRGHRVGPCIPGTHPATRSPFGVDDLTGSEWEWISGVPDIAQPKQGAMRGGAFGDFGVYLAIPNRGPSSTGERYGTHGLRICADAP
jgi:formylglycine-generating enzyme required for sulfatase activity